MTLPQPDWDRALFGIDGDGYGIYDGCIAWLMDDLTIVNRFAGLPGWEDVAERTDEWIEDYGHLAQEAAMRELWALGAELPEPEGGEDGGDNEVQGGRPRQRAERGRSNQAGR